MTKYQKISSETDTLPGDSLTITPLLTWKKILNHISPPGHSVREPRRLHIDSIIIRIPKYLGSDLESGSKSHGKYLPQRDSVVADRT